MTIGVPKEIKIGETRVSMTPSLCRRCVSLGAKVLIQKGAGLTAGFSDAEIASELGISAEAVKSNRRYARATLRKRLGAKRKDAR